MSDQQPMAPASAPAPGAEGAKPYDIHKCAMDAEKAAEKLATELGKADADPQVIKAVSSMADAFRQIATTMAKAESRAGASPPSGGRETMQSATDGLAAEARQPR